MFLPAVRAILKPAFLPDSVIEGWHNSGSTKPGGWVTVLRIALILVGVFLLSAAFSGDSSPPVQDAPKTEAVSAALNGCPELKRDQSDPVGGKNCVRELQMILRDLNYKQALTGRFAELTEANVKDFQRRHGIPVIGVVGPQTRAALMRESSPSKPGMPAIPEASYVTDICSGQQCDLYLSRSTTHRYAKVIADHPVATAAVSTAILRTACIQVFKLTIAAIACGVVADHHAVRIKNALATAARQRACLHVTLRLPDAGQSVLAYSADNSSRCKDSR